jgi:WXG100 family type VII secretion target
MIFNIVRSAIQGAMSTVTQQQQAAEEVLGNIQGFVPKVQGAWRGGDEQEFEADVARKLVPAMMQLIAAIAGFGGSLGQALDIMDQADSKVKGLVGKLGDLFGKILG